MTVPHSLSFERVSALLLTQCLLLHQKGHSSLISYITPSSAPLAPLPPSLAQSVITTLSHVVTSTPVLIHTPSSLSSSILSLLLTLLLTPTTDAVASMGESGMMEVEEGASGEEA